jgi:phospholipase A1
LKYLFFILLICVNLEAATAFEDALDLYKSGDYTNSFKAFKNLAEKDDDPDAAYYLAYMYENGLGCSKDEKMADQWYKNSASFAYKSTSFDSNHEIKKESKKLYYLLDNIDSETDTTMRQMTESLYNLKTYKTNYLIPLSYRYRGEYPNTSSENSKDVETEFQLSVKFDFAANLLKLNEIYSMGYTQKSFWQSYSTSAYFRESNYNPELFVTIPTALSSDAKFIKSLKFGIAHQSNGQGGTQERSWNYVNATVFTQYKNLFTEFEFWSRLPDAKDYNPQLLDYLGHGDIKFSLPWRKHLFTLLLRSNFNNHAAADFSYSYPINDKNNLFLYVKAFSGYGESLIDYNTYINKVGIGVSISR